MRRVVGKNTLEFLRHRTKARNQGGGNRAIVPPEILENTLSC